LSFKSTFRYAKENAKLILKNNSCGIKVKYAVKYSKYSSGMNSYCMLDEDGE
jgi:hypothetical protein